MPLQLPGFYFDEQKNRYFPISSRPPSSAVPSRQGAISPSTGKPTSQLTASEFSRTKPREPRYIDTLPRSLFAHDRARQRHRLDAASFAATSRSEHTSPPLIGELTTFTKATNTAGDTHYLVGDSYGWICRATSAYNEDDSYHDTPSQDFWGMDFNLSPSSEISSMCSSGSRCVATSAGKTAKITVMDLDSASLHSTLYSLNGLHDIWTSHLSGRSLVIGAERQAVYIEDIDVGPPLRTLETQSDVFSVHKSDSLVYTGARNGHISRFDLRSSKPDALGPLLPGRFAADCDTIGSNTKTRNLNTGHGTSRTSVVHLDIIREWQLLVSHMDGRLATYDLRFLRDTRPVRSFNGHVNTLTRRLGIAVDPQQNFLFAAGKDGWIRGWSLQTGEALHPPSLSNLGNNGSRPPDYPDRPLLATRFLKPIVSMQIAEEPGGLCLFAAGPGGDTLPSVHKYFLGDASAAYQ
ncbi:WD40 repeat-like protein [Pleurotus eryngii]|uniref:WD40 repeat-like protein n=1 Tax=Pleurotus eryngii TaxID=5323 RepID=A0A9P6D1L8_PLEER|nr:WD40 repeat-like protein [Pleurotus eryngii]